MSIQYKVKAIFSSSSYKIVESEYGSGKPAIWTSKEEAQEFANQQMRCFGLTYKVIEA